MNGKITISILIAFLISFASFFFLYNLSPDVHADRENHPFYSQKFDVEQQKIFLIGSSHIGQLNTTHIIEYIHESNPQYDVYNLAINADKPKNRYEDVEKIIDLDPTHVFYGISYRDFQSSFTEPEPYSIQYLTTQILYDFKVDPINPKFVTLKAFRDILSSSSTAETKFDRPNTPFNDLGVRQTEIISDEELKLQVESAKIKDTKIVIQNNEQLLFLKKFIKKLEENQIQVIIFTTPLNKYYIENLSPTTTESFKLILNDISNTYNTPIYDFTLNYAELDIWQNLGHVAYNNESIIFSSEVAKMIEMELDS